MKDNNFYHSEKLNKNRNSKNNKNDDKSEILKNEKVVRAINFSTHTASNNVEKNKIFHFEDLNLIIDVNSYLNKGENKNKMLNLLESLSKLFLNSQNSTLIKQQEEQLAYLSSKGFSGLKKNDKSAMPVDLFNEIKPYIFDKVLKNEDGKFYSTQQKSNIFIIQIVFIKNQNKQKLTLFAHKFKVNLKNGFSKQENKPIKAFEVFEIFDFNINYIPTYSEFYLHDIIIKHNKENSHKDYDKQQFKMCFFSSFHSNQEGYISYLEQENEENFVLYYQAVVERNKKLMKSSIKAYPFTLQQKSFKSFKSLENKARFLKNNLYNLLFAEIDYILTTIKQNNSGLYKKL